MSRPRPVLSVNSIAGSIKAVGFILGLLGLNNAQHFMDTETSVIVSIALGVVTLGGDVLAALHAQSKVTPLESPVAADGTPLAKITELASVQPLLAKVGSAVDLSAIAYRPSPGVTHAEVVEDDEV